MNATLSGRDVRQAIGTDEQFQHKFWHVQRVGWVFGLALLVAAITGLTGSGGLFEQREARSGPHSIEYPRAFRWDADAEIVIRLAPAATDIAVIEIDRQFAEDFQLTYMTPQPLLTRSTNRGSQYIFRGKAGVAATLVWHVRPIRPRTDPSYRLRVNDGDAAILRPFIWP